MDIRLSTAARNRAFSKSISRIRPSIELLLDNIRNCQLGNPIWSVLMLTLTDNLPPKSVNEMGTDDGMLQLSVGFHDMDDWTPSNDERIRAATIDCVRIALNHCEFTPHDLGKLEECLH